MDVRGGNSDRPRLVDQLLIGGGRYLPVLLKSLSGARPHVAYNGPGSRRRSDAVGDETTGLSVSKEEK